MPMRILILQGKLLQLKIVLASTVLFGRRNHWNCIPKHRKLFVLKCVLVLQTLKPKARLITKTVSNFQEVLNNSILKKF